MLFSESQEVAMGRQAGEQVAEEIGLYTDPRLEAYVAGVGKRLAAGSERPGLPWTFRVVDDPAVNAFALPGGFLYVTRGILAHLGSEAELAAVLGHEIGHVTVRLAHLLDRVAGARVEADDAFDPPSGAEGGAGGRLVEHPGVPGARRRIDPFGGAILDR